MNVFSAKSIGLYSLAIGSAIGFFNLVTSYGEANIKAPPPMAGIYAIVAENLPGCLQHKALSFNIQQSGIYLNANLNAIEIENTNSLKPNSRSTTPISNPRPTFSGKLQGQQLDLSGIVPTTICPIRTQLRLSGSFLKSGARTGRQLQQLKGQLWLSDRGNAPGSPVDFTSTQQPLTPSTSSH
jgi:hypothetical protein